MKFSAQAAVYEFCSMAKAPRKILDVPAGSLKNLPSHLISVNLFFIREYLHHYLQVERSSIFRCERDDNKAIAAYISSLPEICRNELELRVIRFYPSGVCPPEVMVRIHMKFLQSISHIEWEKLLKRRGIMAIQIAPREEASVKDIPLLPNFTRIWIMFSKSQRMKMAIKMPFPSIFYRELNFNLEVQEIFKLYGGPSKGFAPSLN